MRATALLLLVPCLLATNVPFETLAVPPELLISSNNADSSFCTSFNVQLNISSNLDWTNPNILGSELSAYYIRGVDGFIAVCGARQQFQACLGDQYAACMNVPRFVSDGEDPNSAASYVQMFNELQFDCNGGFVQAVQSYDCILNIWVNHAQDLMNCVNAFNVTVSKDPNTYCQAAYQAEKCTRQPFQASWWQCERTRVGAGLQQLCPTNYCQVQQKAKVSAAFAGRRRAVEEVIRGNTARNEVMSKLAKKARLRERK